MLLGKEKPPHPRPPPFLLFYEWWSRLDCLNVMRLIGAIGNCVSFVFDPHYNLITGALNYDKSHTPGKFTDRNIK